jgi:Domain of unknown function (DUF4326)
VSSVIHETRTVMVKVEADVGIADMVEELNAIDGVWTDASCQGTIGEGGPHPYRAYVMCHWTPEGLAALQDGYIVSPRGNGDWGCVHPRSTAGLSDGVQGEDEASACKPRRIQRKRVKGWKMPPNTVYVGRPSIWGNPYELRRGDSHELKMAVANYRAVIEANQLSAERFRKPIAQLRGKNLACWCPLDQPCHADVLLEIANSEAGACPGK